MAALDFPNSPAVNDTYTSGNQTWKWNGITWDLITGTVVNTVAGTANQVLVNGGTAAAAGAVTLSLPFSYQESTTALTLTNVTLGTSGTHASKWTRIGNVFVCHGKITLGTSGFVMNDPRLTLPNSWSMASFADFCPVGQGIMYTGGGTGGGYNVTVRMESSTVLRLAINQTTIAALNTATYLRHAAISSTTPTPVAASANDFLSYSFTVQLA